jgi:hypothetical protein
MENILKHETILLYGCGGGFDIYAGIPLYWELLRHNKKVYLANCSFTDDIYKYTIEDKCIVPIFGTEERTKKNSTYFPEHDLAKFLHVPVYAIRLVDNIQISNELNELINNLGITYVVLVDAGHDAVLFGSEKLIGSPFEDVTTVLALKRCKDMSEKKLQVDIVCVSAPTEYMDFDLFIQQYNDYFEERIWKPINQDDIKQFELLLDSTPDNIRSIPNECLLSAMKGVYKKHYENPRLINRIRPNVFDESDFPDVLPETSNYYFIGIDFLIDRSTFYSKLNKDIPLTNAKLYSHIKPQMV